MLLEEGADLVEDIVNTKVGVEGQLGRVKDRNGSISTSTPI